MKILTGLLLLALAGCSAVPVCERFEAHGVVVEGHYFAILDEANIRKLNAMFTGLGAGTCKAE